MENPCLYLYEICELIEEATNLKVSGSTVCRVLHRNGLTRKKVQTIAKQRSLHYRAQFLASIQQFTSDYFVWVDETGSDARNHIRKYGYGITPTKAPTNTTFAWSNTLLNFSRIFDYS